MKYWPKTQLEPDLLGPGPFSHYSWFAYYKIENEVPPPAFWDTICLSFYSTSFNTIRSRKMQQRSIWSDLPTSLLPTALKVLGCVLHCIYNWGSSPLPLLPQKSYHSFTCLSPSAIFPIRESNVLETLPLQFLQPPKLFNSLIKNSIPSFQQHKGNWQFYSSAVDVAVKHLKHLNLCTITYN